MKLIKAVCAGLLVVQGLAMAVRDAAASERVEVVATFSILADMAAQVGGERVRVSSLVGPGGDAHVFQPTPSDAVALKRAALVIENGFGFEGWLHRLIVASGYQGPRVVASEGIAPLSQSSRAGHDHNSGHKHSHSHNHAKSEEGVDPHAWQNLKNATVYVRNIARGLCSVDEKGCATYEANAAAYAKQLSALDEESAARFARLPAGQRKVITSHSAFGHLAKRYDLEIIAPEGVSTEQAAAARDVAALIRQIRKDDIKALFVENISDPRLIEQIARETGLKPAGRLYSDALSNSGGEADTYLAMMRHNTTTIANALEAAQ